MVNDILTIFADEQETIPYRKMVRKVTGSINSAILLQQMCYNWHRSSRDGVFYKFKEACGNSLYNVEDSWLEELGFSRNEYDTALKLIGTKAKTRDDIPRLLRESGVQYCVVYYKDRNNITWFYCNKRAITKVVEESAKLSRERAARIAASKEDKMIESPLSKAEYDSLFPESRKADVPKQDSNSRIYTENTTGEVNNTNRIFEVQEQKPDLSKAKQQKAKDINNFGVKMPQDYDVSAEALNGAIEAGYNSQDVFEEKIKFLEYYKRGKGKTRKQGDWDFHFMYGWLDGNYKRGNIKRNGEFYTTSANQERIDKLKAHSQPLFGNYTD